MSPQNFCDTIKFRWRRSPLDMIFYSTKKYSQHETLRHMKRVSVARADMKGRASTTAISLML
ncbi:MAG: hypothetical protein F6K40_19290 [Okeania sp. SIO3I5]|uniref:hypothetical protein n=1 Tax=Okeania sp. SIO3I5 TaxID=2607805 RepID=UPI0013BC77A3|nr:hypothetical protein [Okeania sp. SIO3I5]NEQ38289.1 hypothetical protein [Okeania sp. SIO3I5]